MTRFRLVLTSILVFAFIAVVAAYAGRRTAAETTDGIPARSFEFTYQVHVPANSDSAGPAHLWIPLPQSDGHQDIRGLRIASPVSHVQGRDPEYGNAFAAFAPTAQQSAAGFDVVLPLTPSAASIRSPSTRLHFATSPPRCLAIQACNATSNPTNSFPSTASSPSLPGSTPPVIPPPSKRPVTSTITCSPPCAMTNPGKAGAAATPSGHALQSVATAPISILCSSALCVPLAFPLVSKSVSRCPK